MKQWEVLKELTDDPNKMFTDGHGNYLKFTDEGLLAWHRLTGELCGLYTFRRDDATNWQLVSQPVPWQEAIQAWKSGKNIYVMSGESKFEHPAHPNEPDSLIIGWGELQWGKWYVED